MQRISQKKATKATALATPLARINVCLAAMVVSAVITDVRAGEIPIHLNSVVVSQSNAERLTLAASLRQARRWLDALGLYNEVLAADINNSQAYYFKTLTLADNGSAYFAWQLYRARPELFSADEARRLEEDRLARMILWGTTYTGEEVDNNNEMLSAELALQNYLNEFPAASADNLRAQLDKVIIDNHLQKHTEVINTYEKLMQQGVTLPGYVLAKVGDSLLAMHKPDQAVAFLEPAVAITPRDAEDIDTAILLAYAYSESEQFDKAFDLLDQLVKAQKPWLKADNSRQHYANLRRLEIDGNQAMMHSYADKLPEAQQALESLIAIAPKNADLHSKLAAIYLRRGWHEKSLLQTAIVDTLEARQVSARITQVEALTQLQRYGAASRELSVLVSLHPEQSHVKQLQRSWHSNLGWNGTVSVAGARSKSLESGANNILPFGSEDSDMQVRLESPVWRDHWRLEAVLAKNEAQIFGSNVDNRHAGLLISYFNNQLDAHAGFGTAFDEFANGTYVQASAGWRFNDAWYSSAQLLVNDPEASLQARQSGIEADSWSLASRWTPNELSRADGRLKQYQYDDGNRKLSLDLSFDHRFVSGPKLLVNGFTSLYTSHSSKNTAPYFSPERDAALRVGAQMEHLVWRRYDRHFRQSARVSVGPYWQQDFGSALVPELRYEHQWQWRDGNAVNYGLSWSRPVYDGNREQRVGFDISVDWRE